MSELERDCRPGGSLLELQRHEGDGRLFGNCYMWSLRFIVLANACLLYLGHRLMYMRVVASGYLEKVGDPPKTTYMPPSKVDDISLEDALQLCSESGAWLLFFMIGVLVVVWPYAQLFSTAVVVHLADVGLLNPAVGCRYLDTINASSKWCFAEVFLSGLVCVIMNFDGAMQTIRLKQLTEHDGEDVEVRVPYAEFEFDLYFEMFVGCVIVTAAVIVSTMLTHWSVAQLSCPTGKVPPEQMHDTEQVSDPEVVPENVVRASRAERMRVETLAKDVTFLIATVGAAWVLICSTMTVVRINRRGVIGNSIGVDAALELSVTGLVSLLWEEALVQSHSYVLIVAAAIGLLVVLVPLAELALLMVSLRTDGATAKRCRSIAVFLYSCDCIEVLLFAALVVGHDIGALFQHRTHPLCGQASILTNNARLADALDLEHLQDSECLVIDSSLGLGWWFFLMALLIRSAAWYFSSAGKASLVKWLTQQSVETESAAAENEDEESPIIQLRFKCALFVLTVLNIGMLVAGHVCLYTHTSFKINIDPANLLDIKPRTLFDLNFLQTVQRSYNAGCYLMCAAVGFFVILLPYAKLSVSMLAVILVDHSMLARDKACHYLEVVNRLAKWSFIEVFFFSLVCVILYVDTPSHQIRYEVASIGFIHVRVPVGIFSIDLFLELLAGAVVLIMAIILSNILTHWVSLVLLPSGIDPERTRLMSESNAPRTDEVANLSKQCLVSAVSAVALLLVGLASPFIKCDRQGSIGKALADRAHLELSINSIASEMQGAPYLRTQPTVMFVSIVVVLLAVVAPVIEMMLLVFSVVLLDSSPSLSRKCRHMAEFIYSFDCIEVLLVNAIIAFFDFSNFVQYNTREECEEVQPMLNDKEQAKALDLTHLSDPDCFVLKFEIAAGWFLLFGTVLLRSAIWRQTEKLAELHFSQKLEDDEARSLPRVRSLPVDRR
jgi:hypothetical protein